MHSVLKNVLTGLALVGCLLLNVWSAAAQEAVPKDHGQIYKRAVAAIDAAEKKLAGNYTAEAKALVKESSSLFGILQKEMPEKMKSMELTPAQDEQVQLEYEIRRKQQCRRAEVGKIGRGETEKGRYHGGPGEPGCGY